jgi:hypothetical protein
MVYPSLIAAVSDASHPRQPPTWNQSFTGFPRGTRHVLGSLHAGRRGGLASLMRKSRNALTSGVAQWRNFVPH